MSYDDYLNYENEQQLIEHIEQKLEELKETYIDKLRDALNEFCK